MACRRRASRFSEVSWRCVPLAVLVRVALLSVSAPSRRHVATGATAGRSFLGPHPGSPAGARRRPAARRSAGEGRGGSGPEGAVGWEPGRAREGGEVVATRGPQVWLEDAQQWLSRAGYREAWEGSAILGELYACAAALITVSQKAVMMSRVAAGEAPLNDAWKIEYGGRLIPVASGICYPFAQLFLAFLLASALTVLIWESWDDTHLVLLNVDVKTQRRRRIAAVMLLLACTVVVSLPPQPDTLGTLF